MRLSFVCYIIVTPQCLLSAQIGGLDYLFDRQAPNNLAMPHPLIIKEQEICFHAM
jgi:hypothetical protein